MIETVFVDTNVLVYARDTTDPSKHTRALAWLSVLWSERAGRLSWQVLQEFYVTVTRKLDPPRPEIDAQEDIASLSTWGPASTDLRLMDRAWAIEDRYGLSWWDALIAAAAQAESCDILLTEDLQDGQRIGTVTVVDPFTHEPGDVLTGIL